MSVSFLPLAVLAIGLDNLVVGLMLLVGMFVYVGHVFTVCVINSKVQRGFYPRDAMLARVIAIATCLSVCPSVCPSRAGIVSKRRKLAA